ncbi:expressed unknown protein [Seminavis robusta]|uniref:Uncharacterized protein n=1 Tax=Seminavis robusta TaxID=568900 RepID=A0A9N8E7N0_9STRA|nr:expressed unknown protein [Seminavis robusta]|eukprot:Sro709_g190930.1 n/a (290) ;mRNA; f:38469-39338
MSSEEAKGKENAGATTAPKVTNPKDSSSCTREELTELVRAIKFAKPDASMRAVHREISQELSKKAGFEFLSQIGLNDVKKIWKKAVTAANKQTSSDVLKLYTVGDASVRLLAQEYSQTAAASEAAKTNEDGKLMLENFVHLFDGVPMDRSGSRPHQALINFNDNNQKKQSEEKNSSGDEKKDDNNNGSSKDERGIIVKVQVAASDDESVLYPMLLYSQDRSLKTFIHPDPEDDGYQKIRKWIMEDGKGGSLGHTGGNKAYFYARLTKRKKGAGSIISVDVTGLAPEQTW